MSKWKQAKLEYDEENKKEIFNFVEGKNEIEINMNVKPRKVINKFGKEQYIISLTNDMIVFVNPVLFELISNQIEGRGLMDEEKVVVTIKRDGLTKDNTRYELL